MLSGRTSFVVDPEVDTRLYEIAGFKVAGSRAVRVDILERLADIIRPLVALDASRPYQGELPAGAAEGNGFRVTVEMTSLLGCSGDDFSSILSSLGYRVRRTPKVVETPAPAEASAETPALEQVLEDNAPSAEANNEAAAPENAEAPVVAEPGEGAVPDAAPAEVEAATEPAAPAEPEFDEVWFPGGRRHNENRRHEGRSRRDGEEGPRQNNRPRHGKGPRRPEGEGQQARPNGKGRPDKTERGDRKDRRPPREERKPVFDPDSPFAALAALRGKSE